MDITSKQVQDKIIELKLYLHKEFDEIEKNEEIYEPKEMFNLQSKLIKNCYQIIEQMIERKITWEEELIYF